MKKLVLFAMTVAVLGIFNACEKSDELIDQSINAQSLDAAKPDVYSENGRLIFKDMNTVDSVILLLSEMSTNELELWEIELGFKSARLEFDKLYKEYDKIDSYEAFLQFKTNNQEKLSFNEQDPEDCSIDYPYATKYFLPILNNQGIFQVGLNIFKYTKNDQYIITDGDLNKVENINSFIDAPEVITFPRLKSNVSVIHAFPEDNPNGTYDEYHRKPNISKRKLKNELFIDRYVTKITTGQWKRGYYVILNQKGQKKSWGKYRNYNTTYGMRKIRLYIQSVANFQDTDTYISPEVKPSINFALASKNEIVSWPDPYTPPLMAIPDINYAAEVSFRGFGFLDNDFYQIEDPESLQLRLQMIILLLNGAIKSII